MPGKKIILYLLLTSILFSQEMLLFYCGTTMAAPMREIADRIEKKHACKIKIIQGGSRDLYQTLVFSKKGDLFLPGDSKYIEMADSYINEQKALGYNHLALFVKKGNPYGIAGLEDLLREDLLVSYGNPETCSIGVAAEESMIKYGGLSFLNRVKENLSFYASDSRDLNRMLIDGKVDIGLNWIATQFLPDYKEKIIHLPLDKETTVSKKLVIALLHTSVAPDVAKAFIRYADSDEGRAIMRKYGFSNE